MSLSGTSYRKNWLFQFFLFSTYLYYSLFPPFPHQSNIRPLLFLLFLFLEQCRKGANVRKHVLASHIWTEQVLRWNHLCRVERCEIWWKAFSTIMTIIKFEDSKSAFWLRDCNICYVDAVRAIGIRQSYQLSLCLKGFYEDCVSLQLETYMTKSSLMPIEIID